MSGRVLGFDVGGSKLRAAIADGTTIVGELSEPTRQGSAREVVAQMAGMAGRLNSQVGHGTGAASPAIQGVGISVPTYVDHAGGRLGVGPGVPGLAGPEVMRLLQAAFPIPLVIDNDANLAALAEGALGAAVGVQNYVVVLLSVGIGMGIVVNGEVWHGHRGRAGEIGRLPLSLDPTSHGRNAPPDYESLMAGAAVRERRTRAAVDDRSSSLSSARSMEDTGRSAQSGDATAERVIRDEARLIARGLAAVIAVLDPELICLCGAFGSVPSLIGPVREEVQRLLELPPRIVTSKLGDRGELMGALIAASAAAADAARTEGQA